MDRWKRKELKCMELGGNKNAAEYYEANGMSKDGKPDHEAAPHSRYKMELAAKAEAAVKAELPQVQQQQAQMSQQRAQQSPTFPQENLTSGLQANPFDMSGVDQSNNTQEMNKPVPQAQLQSFGSQEIQATPSATAPMTLGKPKVTSLQQVGNTGTGGGMTFARKQENGAVKSLNAKKLDIDFGGDDFFNSFQPMQEEEQVFKNFGGEKKSSKLQEVTDTFGWGANLGGDNSSNTMSVNLGGDKWENQLNEEAARAKLATMGNRKAISSADFVDHGEQSQEIQDKFRALQMSGATQISSDMMFGNQAQAEPLQPSLSEKFTMYMGRSSDASGGQSDRSERYEEFKAAAAQVAGRVGEKASQMKASASDWFTQFKAKDGGRD